METPYQFKTNEKGDQHLYLYGQKLPEQITTICEQSPEDITHSIGEFSECLVTVTVRAKVVPFIQTEKNQES